MVNKKCHVFTPVHIVNKMLDEVGYVNNLYEKSFLENSCGDGNIICEAVKRYIVDCINNGIDIKHIIMGLETNFVGVEINKLNYKKCIQNLNKIAEYYGLEDIKWNIINSDFLNLNIDKKFDYIVGNPPYVSYINIDNNNRKYIREKFNSCKKGKFDYCYPFIELSLSYLNDNGRMAYLIPTNIFKNVFAKDLRELMINKIVKIIDYTTEKIFKNILTSSSIIICESDSNNIYIEYYDVIKFEKSFINKKNLKNKWVFKNENDKKKVLFSEYFLAATSIATLLNEAFVIKEYREKENYLSVYNINIEKSILKPAASPRSLSKGIKEFIIFPYKYSEKNIIKIELEEFYSMYPGAAMHLGKFKEKLNLRNLNSKSKWFEYGRSQALENLNQKKLLLSSIVTNRVKVYELDENTIPYSGIYIISKSNLTLFDAKTILESEEFLEYVKRIGIYVSGSSLRITANDIKNFDISKWR